MWRSERGLRTGFTCLKRCVRHTTHVSNAAFTILVKAMRCIEPRVRSCRTPFQCVERGVRNTVHENTQLITWSSSSVLRTQCLEHLARNTANMKSKTHLPFVKTFRLLRGLAGRNTCVCICVLSGHGFRLGSCLPSSFKNSSQYQRYAAPSF